MCGHIHPRREQPAWPTIVDMVCHFTKLKLAKFECGSDPLVHEEYNVEYSLRLEELLTPIPVASDSSTNFMIKDRPKGSSSDYE